MRSHNRRLAAFTRLAVVTLVAIAIATPAAAQFGALKKKIKKSAGQEEAAPEAQGGMIVLTEEVVSQLLTGLRAGQAEREAAAEGDSPYTRYKEAEAAYSAAVPKCKAAEQTFMQRMANNEKTLEKYNALLEKMVAAQGKGDTKLMAIYQDSAMAMQDPSCTVKKPEQPRDYYQAQRGIDSLAEMAEVEASGFTPGELAIVKERADAILRGAPAPGGASPMEKSAVAARAAELKPLLGIKEQPVVQAAKPEPAPAPAPAPAGAQPSPGMSAAASSTSDCMTKNVMSRQAEIEALGERAEAAQAAGDTQRLMAIADTMQQIQMAGCR